MKRSRGIGLALAAASAALALAAPAAQAALTSLTVNKCLAGKLKAVGKSAAARLGCYAKDTAAPDAGALAACLAKAEGKLTGGADPTKGAFEKLEARYAPASATPCRTFDDTVAVDGALGAYATSVDGGVGDAAGTCDAAKKKCVGKYVGAVLGCYAKAAGKGGTIDAACLDKALTKLTDGSKGCLDKAAAAGDCTHPGDAAALASAARKFAEGDTCGLDPGNSGCTCPGRLAFTPDASDLGSELDLGWSGIDHDQPFATNTDLTFGIACLATGPPCGTCTLSGPVTNDTAAGELDNRRCTNDTAIHCSDDTPCAAGGGACAYYLGPPLGHDDGGLPVCIVQSFAGAVSGTADVDSGALALGMEVAQQASFGIFLDAPCPRCVGDGTPNDGLRGGTCSGGQHIGASCDANGTTPLRPDHGATSLDCPPSTLSAIGSRSVSLTATTDTVVRTLSAANPTCSYAYVPGTCLCDTCNDLAGEVCQTNADCPPSGGQPGICGGQRCRLGANAGAPCSVASECPGGSCSRLGEPTRPNACAADTSVPFDWSCVDTLPLGDGKGLCTFGPKDRYCSNHPQRGCLSDAECDAVAGTCVERFRSCFTDNGSIGGNLIAPGASDPPVGGTASPTLASIFCEPPTGVPAVNVTMGLPGPARLLLHGTLRLLP